MALIPVFKDCTRDYLIKKWGVKFPTADWVEADIRGELYESNRYDISLKDELEGKTICVYLYMDEDSERVLAIDEIVQDTNDNVQYRIEETPFADILDDIFKL
jgi:hypothetical protein